VSIGNLTIGTCTILSGRFLIRKGSQQTKCLQTTDSFTLAVSSNFTQNLIIQAAASWQLFLVRCTSTLHQSYVQKPGSFQNVHNLARLITP
jgi:hypothetical protein